VNWKTAENQRLIQAILSLKTPDEARRFLRDLMTKEEITECAQRWEAARLLDQKISYVQIQKKTGLSSTTVARISRWLQRGMGGYKLVLDRMNHHPNIPF